MLTLSKKKGLVDSVANEMSIAYACAKANRATLLFKGNDFTKTDIRAAR